MNNLEKLELNWYQRLKNVPKIKLRMNEISDTYKQINEL